MGEGVRRIDLVVRVLLLAGEANERLRQPVFVVNIIEAEAPLDAEPVLIRRSVAAFRIDDLLILDVVGHLAADAAIGAKGIDLAVGPDGARLLLVEEGRGHQGAGRAGLHAFPASDAGRFPHRVVEVEHDLGARVPVGHADHIVDLHLAAAAHAKPALDASVKIDAHGGVAWIGRPPFGRGKAARGDPGLVRPAPQLRARIMGGFARRLVGDEKLHHHVSRLRGTLGRGLDLHAGSGVAHAGGGEHALALDLDHADAAIAVRAVAGLRQIAKMGDLGAEALRHLPDGLAGLRLDILAVELEHDIGHSAASLGANSSGKYLITLVKGFEAAWPSPQIEASRIASDNSPRSSRSHALRVIKATAFCVPARQGVHWPQLSSSKKRIRLSAASFTSSLSERTTTAAE